MYKMFLRFLFLLKNCIQRHTCTQQQHNVNYPNFLRIWNRNERRFQETHVDGKVTRSSAEPIFPRPVQTSNQRFRATTVVVISRATVAAVTGNGRIIVGTSGHGNDIASQFHFTFEGGQVANGRKVTRQARTIQQDRTQNARIGKIRQGSRQGIAIQQQDARQEVFHNCYEWYP